MNVLLARTVSLTAAGAVLLTGCGGSAKPALDQSTPSGVVKGYLAAVADKDGGRACRALSPAVQRRAIKLIGKPSGGALKTCKEALSVVTAQYTSKEQDLLRQAKVTKVTVRGGQATVTSTGSGKLTITKIAGRWTITNGLFK